jgi:hypothetical protein
VGTPDDCLQQLGDLQKVTGHEHLVAEFSFGNLPHHEAEKNVRLFADRVLPTLQRDPAFAGGKRTAAASSTPRRAASGGIFAPA